jgi:hypothetical protein
MNDKTTPCPQKRELPQFRYAQGFVCGHCGKRAANPADICFPIERKD